MENIQESVDAIGGIQFFTVVYLNMVYYEISFDECNHKLCKTVLLLVKYQYRGIPMIVSITPDSFHK